MTSVPGRSPPVAVAGRAVLDAPICVRSCSTPSSAQASRANRQRQHPHDGRVPLWELYA